MFGGPLAARLRKAMTPKYRQTPIWRSTRKYGSFHQTREQERWEIAAPRYFGEFHESVLKDRAVDAQWRCELRDATVYNPSWAVTSAGILWQQETVTELPYAAAGYSPHFERDGGHYRFRTEYALHSSVERAALIAHRTGFNYLHAICEVLPKIFELDKLDPDQSIPAILEPGLLPTIQGLLHDFLNGRPTIILPPERCINVGELHCFSAPAFMPDDPHFELRAGALSPTTLSEIAERTRIAPATTTELLFVSKMKYQQRYEAAHAIRNVANHELLDAALQGLGATTIFPEEHSWAEQRDIFASAKRIVMVAGAGCANLIFCQPNTKVLLLARNDKGNYGFFSSMLDTLSLEHAWLLGEAETDDIHSSYVLNADALQRGLNWLVGKDNHVDGLMALS